jgi:hypothetical protein
MSDVVFAGKCFKVQRRTHAARSVYYIITEDGEERLLSTFPLADRKRPENAAYFNSKDRQGSEKRQSRKTVEAAADNQSVFTTNTSGTGTTVTGTSVINDLKADEYKHDSDSASHDDSLRQATLSGVSMNESEASVTQSEGSESQSERRLSTERYAHETSASPNSEILQSVRNIGPIAVGGVVYKEYDVASAARDAGKLAQFALLMWEEKKSNNWPMLYLFVSEHKRDKTMEAIHHKSPHFTLQRMVLRVPVRLDVNKYELERPNRSMLP